MLGPFDTLPFSNLRINPVGLVPKKSIGWRLKTNLSHPCSSVNDFIHPSLCYVQYSKFDNVFNSELRHRGIDG